MCIISKIKTWYRAQNYCPVIDSLQSEPEMWVDSRAYGLHKLKDYKPRYRGDSGPHRYYSSSSLYHKELNIEIENWDYSSDSFKKIAKRNGHVLPVCGKRLQRVKAVMAREAAAKKVLAARAELNRITQDAQTLRLARIVELRKALAVAEAAEFNFKLEDQSNV